MASTAVKGNGFDGDKVKAFVERIENVEAEIDSRKGEYMAWCKAKREDIKEIIKEAKDLDIPAKALKTAIQYRKKIRQAEELLDSGDQDDDDLATALIESLGDFAELPLGMAAVEAAGGNDAVDNLGK